MSEMLRLKEPGGANRGSFFHPFFTDTLRMKAWLVTAAVVPARAWTPKFPTSLIFDRGCFTHIPAGILPERPESPRGEP
jgi:hypothetical protein